VKRRDAIAALHHITATLDHAAPAAPDFEATEFWHQLVATTDRRAGAGDAPRVDRVIDHARVTQGDGPELRRSALLALLASLEADRSGLQVGRDELARAAERLRRRLGLVSAARTRRFLSDQGLSEDDFAEACRLEVIYDQLIRRSGRAHEAATVAELRRSGRYAELAGSAELVQQILAARGSVHPSLADAGIDEAALLAWYAARFRPIRGGLELLLTDGSGETETRYIAKDAKLPLGVEMTAPSQMGKVPVSVTTTDYRDVNGLKFSFRIDNKTAGQSFTITVWNIELSAPIDPKTFEVPDDIKALAAHK
jgi:hypothetical protein